jgi:hypothetical protein
MMGVRSVTEVRKARDHDGDGGALGLAGGGVGFGGGEPGRDEPADAEDGCREVEDDNARNIGGEERDVEVGFVCCETAKEDKDTKGDCFTPCG